jgi:putative transposase
MADIDSVALARVVREDLEAASPDLLRRMVKAFADALMSAEADVACGAGYGQISVDRVNRRNGYRAREWDTRAGTVELAIPKLREGSYYPDWLLTRAGGPIRPWSAWSPPATCWGSARGGSRSSSSSSA